VLFIVEGNSDEPRIIRRIFRDILGLKCTRIGRNGMIQIPDGGEIRQYSSTDNSDIIYIIQAKRSNMLTIINDQNYIENIFAVVRSQYGIRLDNFSTFYLFDRDHGSNTDINSIRMLLKNMSDPYDSTTDDSLKGLLLLSYPCSQSYIASCFEDDCYSICTVNCLIFGYQLKRYLRENEWIISHVDMPHLVHALKEFNHVITSYEYTSPYDVISRMAESNVDMFDQEETYFRSNRAYGAFSTISLVLYFLNVATI
jgi:hypothetical protein